MDELALPDGATISWLLAESLIVIMQTIGCPERISDALLDRTSVFVPNGYFTYTHLDEL